VATINGTSGNDTISGTTSADTIHGLDGNDRIDGDAGNDTIYGDGGADTIFGGAGNDSINGGAGDDQLNDGAGDDVVHGGDGNDTLSVDNYNGSDRLYGDAGNDSLWVFRYYNQVIAPSTFIADGGSDDDYFRIGLYDGSSITISGGDGSDTVDIFYLSQSSSAAISLGTGFDVLRLDQNLSSNSVGAAITVSDFAVGDTGDRIEWSDFLASALSGWDGSDNPFGSGFLRIMQSGSDTLVQVDQNGGGDGYATLLTLFDTQANALTSFNLDGYSPADVQSDQILEGTSGDDTLIGGAGNDTINGNDGNDSLYGNDGNDRINGGDGNDLIDGGSGDDILRPGIGSDTLIGGDGNDTIAFNAVLSTNAELPQGQIVGGAGIDTIDLRNVSPASASVNASQLIVTVGSQQFTVSGVERLLFGGSDDFISLSAASDSLRVFGGAGNDYLSINPSSAAFGQDGDDTFWISGSFGSATSGQVDGGSGTDLLKTNIGFVVDLAAGTAESFEASYSIAGIENVSVSLSGYAATAFGDDGANVLSVVDFTDDGRAGVTFYGRGGNDELLGSSGDDVLEGGAGNDTLDGGAGNDTASYAHASTGVTVDLGTAAPQDTGEGIDTLVSIENVTGSAMATACPAHPGPMSWKVSAGRTGSSAMPATICSTAAAALT
jgi:Ca2+-binding RTX toxin-like protein